MQNIDIRFNTHSNNTSAVRGIKELRAEYDRLNKEIQQVNKTALATGGVVGREMMTKTNSMMAGYRKSIDEALAAQNEFIVSSKKIETQSGALNRKLSDGVLKYRDLKQSGLDPLKQAYRDQIAMNNMLVDSFERVGMSGAKVTMMIPKNAGRDIDSFRTKLGFAAAVGEQLSRDMVNWGKNTQWAGRQLTVGFTMPLGMAALAVGKLGYDADAAMTRIVKVYGDGSSAVKKSSQEIRQEAMTTARELAKTYGQSGKDTFNMMGELAALGASGPNLVQQTKAISRGQLLGELNPEDALKAARTLQAVYGQTNNQLNQSFNLMNAIENSTSLTMQDIVTMLPKAASTLNTAGITFKEALPLFVAMKAGGIEAAEGANAMKSMTISSLDPTKRAIESFKELTGKDLNELAANSKNGAEMFSKIAVALNSIEEPAQRIEMINKIFGKYRASTAATLLRAMGEAAKGSAGSLTEYARAVETSKGSEEDYAKSADSEIKAIQNSPSNRIKRELESIKISATSIGLEILPVLGKIAGGVANVFEMFEKLPAGVKSALMIGTVATAVAGPVLMLLGLMGNLTGQGLKTFIMMGKFLGLFKKFDLTTPELKAAQLLQETMSKSMDKTTNSAQRQALAIQRLTDELRMMSLTQNATIGSAAPSVGKRVTTTAATSTGPKGLNVMSAPSMQRKYADRDNSIWSMESKAKNTKESVDQLNNSVSRTSAGVNKLAMGFGAASLAAGGMLSMFGGSGSQNIANGLFAASMLSPILDSAFVAKRVQGVKDAIGRAGIGQKLEGVIGGGAQRGFASAKSSAASFASYMASPWGLAIAGGVALGIASLKELEKEIKKIKDTADDANTSSTWAKVMGFDEKKNAAASPVSPNGIVNESVPAQVKEMAYNTNFLDKIKKENVSLYNQIQTLSKQTNDTITQSEKEKFVAYQASIMRASGATENQVRQASRALISVVKGDVDSTSLKLKVDMAIKDPSVAIGEQMRTLQTKINEGTYEGLIGGTERFMRENAGQNNFIGKLFAGVQGNTARYAALDAASGMQRSALNSIEQGNIRGNVQSFWNSISGMSAPQREAAIKQYAQQIQGGMQRAFQDLNSNSFIQNNDFLKNQFGDITTLDAFIAKVEELKTKMDPAQYNMMLRSFGVSEKDIESVNLATNEWAKLNGTFGVFESNSIAVAEGAALITKRMMQLGAAGGWAAQEAERLARLSIEDPSKVKGKAIFTGEYDMATGKMKDTTTATLALNKAMAENKNGTLASAVAAGAASSSWTKYLDSVKKTTSYGSKIDSEVVKNIQKVTAATKPGVNTVTELGNAIKKTTGNTPAISAMGKELEAMMTKIEQGAGPLLQRARSSSMDIYYSMAERQYSKRQEGEKSALEKRIENASKAIDTRFSNEEKRVETRFDNASKALDRKDEGQKAWIDRREKLANDSLDNKHKNIERAFSKQQRDAQRAFESQQKLQEKMLDNQQQKRRDALEEKYDNRIKKINESIEAERKAEEARQKIFEAEKERIRRSASLFNSNVDFNAAISAGDLDEAAKIAASAQAQQDEWSIDDAAEKSQSGSDARIATLEGRIELIEKEKQARLDALTTVEEKEKESLERRLQTQRDSFEDQQQLQREALDKKLGAEREQTSKLFEEERKRQEGRLAIERNALDRSKQANMTSIANRRASEQSAANSVWESWRRTLENRQFKENATLNAQLSALRSYIPRNEGEQKGHIKALEKLYAKHGVNLSSESSKWSGIMKTNFTSQMEWGRRDLMGLDWTAAGRSTASQMVQGAFGMSWQEAMTYIKTGDLPKNWNPAKASASSTAAKRNSSTKGQGNLWLDKFEYRHSGGVVGGPGASAKSDGASINLKNGERPVIMQDGEGVLSKSAMAKPGVKNFMHSANIGDNYTPAPSGVATVFMQSMMSRLISDGIFQGMANSAMRQVGMDPKSSSPGALVGSAIAGTGFGLPNPLGRGKHIYNTPPMSIPAHMLSLYQRAASRFGIPWTLLAGIGMEETLHGRNKNTSYAGAQGAMQFMPATFAAYGIDGDGDGRRDIRNNADSVFSAANYLVAMGAKNGAEGVRKAIWRYNHADWYVNDVLSYAKAYGGGNFTGGTGAFSRPTDIQSLLSMMGNTAGGGMGLTPGQGIGQQGAWKPYPGLPGLVTALGAGMPVHTWLLNKLKGAFPNAYATSGFRPGTKYSAEGVISNHWIGRALDLPPKMEYYNWILRNFPIQNIRDLIFSPGNPNQQVYNGRWINMASGTKARHHSHIHVALKNGGRVPGMGVGDVQPAMLEPGELVVRKAAVDSMDPALVSALNHWDSVGPRIRINNGGISAGPRNGGIAESTNSRYSISIDMRGAVVDKETDFKSMIEDGIRQIEYEKGEGRHIR